MTTSQSQTAILDGGIKLLWNIEVREAGVWNAVDYADSLEDALMLASSLCATVREEWIRISTPDFKII